jgi:gamma-glutamyl phosphate reductase
MEHAKESKTIVRLRKKLKRRLREESKIVKKSVLKKISQIIRIRFNKQILDAHTVDVIEGRHENLPSGEVIQKLRAKIIRDSERLSSLTSATSRKFLSPRRIKAPE